MAFAQGPAMTHDHLNSLVPDDVQVDRRGFVASLACIASSRLRWKRGSEPPSRCWPEGAQA